VDYSLRGLAYLVLSYSCIYKEKLYTAVEEIFYYSQEVALVLNRYSDDDLFSCTIVQLNRSSCHSLLIGSG
jgi:hypothetical protein